MKLLIFCTFLVLSCSALDPLQGLECASCHLTIEALRAYAKESEHWNKLCEIFVDLCVESGQQKYVCQGLVNEFSPVVTDVLVDKILDPEFLCMDMEYCTSPHYVEENFTLYATEIMKGKPSGPGPKPTGENTIKFGHIADAHIDLYYTPGTSDECDEPQCCRSGTGNAGYWGGMKCDLPLRTLEAALDQVAAMNLDFIIVTGDVPPHDVWNQSRSYNLLNIQTEAQLFQKHIPNTPIYKIFGNHAPFPINEYDYINDPYLPKAFCEYWNLDSITRFDLEKHAGYTIKHGDNLRLIVLDTNTMHSGNLYLALNSTNPQGQLTWLYEQLLAAEKSNEVVYIFGHVPPGDDFSLSNWARHYAVLMDRFEFTVAGTFYAHTHNDEIHIDRGVFSGKPTQVQWTAPSLTTYSYKNPSIRVFEADAKTKTLLDYTQYRLNLAEANKNSSQTPVWEPNYSFKNLYGVSDLSPQSIYVLALEIGNNENLALQYLSNFNTGINAPTRCDSKCMHILTCTITYGILDDELNCQGVDKNWLYKLNEMLFGKWTYKVK